MLFCGAESKIWNCEEQGDLSVAQIQQEGEQQDAVTFHPDLQKCLSQPIIVDGQMEAAHIEQVHIGRVCIRGVQLLQYRLRKIGKCNHVLSTCRYVSDVVDAFAFQHILTETFKLPADFCFLGG